MKPILDDQSAITYSSVVILILTFFIYLVAQHSDQAVVESRIDGIYRSFGWVTPREQLIARTKAGVEAAFLLPLSFQSDSSGVRELALPLSLLFVDQSADLRASALKPLGLIVNTLRSSALSVELLVQQTPIVALSRDQELELGLKRAGSLIRFFNDSGIEASRFSVKTRASTGPWVGRVSVSFTPLTVSPTPASIVFTGNHEEGLRVG